MASLNIMLKLHLYHSGKSRHHVECAFVDIAENIKQHHEICQSATITDKRITIFLCSVLSISPIRVHLETFVAFILIMICNVINSYVFQVVKVLNKCSFALFNFLLVHIAH